MSGLGQNLLPVKQAARIGVVSIIDMDNPRLVANNLHILLQELEWDLYSFPLELIDNSCASELEIRVTA